MLKVLLVDDEIFTIHMLQIMIHWKEMGLELIGYAQNGEDAYNKVISDKPDIIISDIKMPVMDGLEFLKKVYVSHPEIKAILMSAYSDFSYVKEGMKLGANDYVLKPIDELELELALRKTVVEIQGEDEQKKIISQSVIQLKRLNLFQYIKTGKGINKVHTAEEFTWLDKTTFYMYRIQLNNATIAEYSNAENIGLSQEGYISRILESIISEWSEKYMVLDFEEDCWLLIFNAIRDIKKELVAKKIFNEMKERIGIHVNIYFGSEGKKVEDLPVLFKDICNLDKYSFYIGEEYILGYGYNCNKEELDEIRNIGIKNELKMTSDQQNIKKIQENYSRPVQESISIIEENYNMNLSLENICEKVSVSKNYFSYLFKRETGMNLWNYLTFIRLQHARKLLETTNLRSYEIAFQVGYENPSYFSAIFKKYEKISPNEYREQKRNIQT